jgi:hypothetical protein
MTTFLIVTGVVVAVLLVFGWLWDRRFGFNADRMQSPDRRAQADADARTTQHGASHLGGGV